MKGWWNWRRTSRLEALAVSQLASLLAAGVPSAEAIQRIADHLPPSGVKAALTRTAAATRDGAAPDRALSEAFPQFASLLAGAGIALPSRLSLLGEHLLHSHTLTRRLAAVAAYPAVVAAGAGVILIVLNVTYELMLDLMMETQVPLNHVLLSFFSVLMAVVVIFLTVTTVLASWKGAVPLWVRLLPGGKMWELMASARFLNLYALHRDPAGGGLEPEAAIAASAAVLGSSKNLKAERGSTPVSLLLGCGLPRDEAVALVLGERSGEVVRVAREEASRLEQLSAEAADLLIRSIGHSLLVLAGVAVLMLYLVFFLSPMFRDTMQITGGM